jgi:hypothetical protein
MSQTMSIPAAEIAAAAKAVQAKLEALWADEGVDQLQIFLDPGTYSVLAEIRKISLDFIQGVVDLSD